MGPLDSALLLTDCVESCCVTYSLWGLRFSVPKNYELTYTKGA